MEFHSEWEAVSSIPYHWWEGGAAGRERERFIVMIIS